MLLLLSKNHVNTPSEVCVSAITNKLRVRGLGLLLGAVLSISPVTVGKQYLPPQMCLFGRRIYSGWLFFKKLRLRKWALLPPPQLPKEI